MENETQKSFNLKDIYTQYLARTVDAELIVSLSSALEEAILKIAALTKENTALFDKFRSLPPSNVADVQAES